MSIFYKIIILIFLLFTFLVDLVSVAIKILFGMIFWFTPNGIITFLNYIDVETQILLDDLDYILCVLNE